jgi:hypothetical protein
MTNLNAKTKKDLITKTPAVACPPAVGRNGAAGEIKKVRKRERVSFLKSKHSSLFTNHRLLFTSVLIGEGIDDGY